jgi:hypothetical protein
MKIEPKSLRRSLNLAYADAVSRSKENVAWRIELITECSENDVYALDGLSTIDL